MTNRQEFFAFARKRHEIYLRRRAGDPWPWTDDHVLRTYSFTNVFRELDRTTIWFRENVRDALRDRPEVLLATVVFRVFNRVTTGEVIFRGGDDSVFARFLKTGDTADMRHAIVGALGVGPFFTGAYCVAAPAGYSKLDGMLLVLTQFAEESSWREEARKWRSAEAPLLRDACLWFKQWAFFGGFTSYEVVTDLRHTALLSRAADIMSWCNIGPGSRRGLDAVRGRRRDKETDEVGEVQSILQDSLRPDCWPSDWPRWEMRDAEHTLCEFYKYERTRLGGAPPRNLYHRNYGGGSVK
jgi:hypothetical protein